MWTAATEESEAPNFAPAHTPHRANPRANAPSRTKSLISRTPDWVRCQTPIVLLPKKIDPKTEPACEASGLWTGGVRAVSCDASDIGFSTAQVTARAGRPQAPRVLHRRLHRTLAINQIGAAANV